MNNRAPRLVVIGMPFKNRQGETRVPRAFIHPCFKEGCDDYAAWGFGERFACRAHRNELSTLFDQRARISTGEADASTRDGGLFAGDHRGPRP